MTFRFFFNAYLFRKLKEENQKLYNENFNMLYEGFFIK